MLESLESETPNIKDLSLEETEPNVPDIDLEKDLDWHSILMSIVNFSENRQYEDLAKYITDIQIVNPDKLQQINLPSILNQLKEHLKYLNDVTQYPKSDYWVGTLKLASTLRQVAPALIPKKLLTDGMYSSLLNNIANRDFGKGGNYAEYISMLNILFPDKGITFGQEDRRAEFLENVNKKSPYYFSFAARRYLTAYAGSRNDPGKDIVISKEQWKETFQTCRQILRRDYGEPNSISLVANIKILRAKEVRVTEHGIELIGDRFDDTSINGSEAPPLPEQRSF